MLRHISSRLRSSVSPHILKHPSKSVQSWLITRTPPYICSPVRSGRMNPRSRAVVPVGLRGTPQVPSSAGQPARTSACGLQFSISIMRTRISTFNHKKRDSSQLIMSDYLREGMSEISMPNGSSSLKSKRIISVANLLIPFGESPASPYP